MKKRTSSQLDTDFVGKYSVIGGVDQPTVYGFKVVEYTVNQRFFCPKFNEQGKLELI